MGDTNEDMPATTLQEIMKMLMSTNTKLDSIQKDIKTSKDEIKEYVDEKLAKFDTEIGNLKQKVQGQEDQIHSLETKILEQEIADKRRNIIFFNVVENEKTHAELTNYIANIVREKLNIEITATDVDYVYRIGKKSNDPRPIILGCIRLTLKEEIMRNRKKLASTNIRISEDLPLSIREKRKSMAPIVKSLYDEGFKVHMKHEKIMVDGKECSKEKALEVINKNANKKSSSDMSPIEKENQKKKQIRLRIPASKPGSSPKSTPKSAPPNTIRQFMIPNERVTTPSKNEQQDEQITEIKYNK